MLAKTGKDEFYHLRGVRLGLLKKDTASAIANFQDLCRIPEAPKDRLQSAMEAFTKAGEVSAAQAALDEILEQTGINKNVAELWVHSIPKTPAQARIDRVRERLEKFSAADDAKRLLAIEYLDVLKQSKKKAIIHDYVTENRDFLSANNAAWGSVGYVYSSLQENQECVNWLRDWQVRKETKPWMLLNLVLSLRRLNQVEDAIAVGKATQQMPPDHCSDMHAMWLTSDAVLMNADYETALKLRPRDREKLSNYYKFVYDLLSHVLTLSSKPAETRTKHFALARLRKSSRCGRRISKPMTNSAGATRY